MKHGHASHLYLQGKITTIPQQFSMQYSLFYVEHSWVPNPIFAMHRLVESDFWIFRFQPKMLYVLSHKYP